MHDRLVRYQPAPGLQTLLSPRPGILDFITFSVLRLAGGENWRFQQPAHETVLVLLNGDVTFQVGGEEWRAARENVFIDPAASLFLPPPDEVHIRAHSASEIAVASAPSPPNGAATTFFGPDSARVRQVGKDNWQRRVVTLLDVDSPAEFLIVGETFNPPGNWSSYPPHRHDFNRPPQEIAMEEVYFYRLDPAHGFGLQRIYTEDGRVNHTWTIEHNHALPIYEGFHPVVAGGGYNLYYLWILAGNKKELIPFTDPRHAWLLTAH